VTPAAPAIARVRRPAQRPLFDAAPASGAARRQDARERAGGEGLTLGLRLDRVWEGLAVAGAAVCPVCDGELRRAREGPGAAAACARCGSVLT
jgi:hypothetical protein